MVYPHEVMEDNMVFAYKGEGGEWKRLLKKYNADFALVEKDNPVLSEMGEDREWAIAVTYLEGALLVKKAWLQALPDPLILPDRKESSWP